MCGGGAVGSPAIAGGEISKDQVTQVYKTVNGETSSFKMLIIYFDRCSLCLLIYNNYALWRLIILPPSASVLRAVKSKFGKSVGGVR